MRRKEMGRGIEEGAEKLWMTGYVHTSIGTWMERLIYLLTDRSLYIYMDGQRGDGGQGVQVGEERRGKELIKEEKQNLNI